MPLPTSPDIEVVFDLKADFPIFKVTDVTDYAGATETLTGGFITIIDPNGTVIYSTPNGAPDFLPNALTFDQVLIPTDLEEKVIQGSYLFQYKAETTNNPQGFQLEVAFDFNFKSPNPTVEHELDCFIARLRSKDTTNYTVNNIEPTIGRVHQIFYPAFLELPTLSSASPILDINYPNLHEGTYSIKLTSTLVYDFPGAFSVCTEVELIRNITVKCDTNLCKIYCCIRSLKLRLARLKCANPTEYLRENKLLAQVTALMVLFNQSSKCGKPEDATSYLTEILEITGCEEGCKCGGCSENQPQQIKPYAQQVNTSSSCNAFTKNFSVPGTYLQGDWLTIVTPTEATTANISHATYNIYERIDPDGSQTTEYQQDAVLLAKVTAVRRIVQTNEWQAQFAAVGDYAIVLVGG